MHCPACGSLHDIFATRCHCGHELPARQTSAPWHGSAPVTRRLRFHGDGRTLFGIYLKVFVLSAITLGIYFSWGKVRIRQYIYSQTELDGDRFAFHGTGGELFRGGLKAAGILLLLLLQMAIWPLVMGDRAAGIIGEVVLWGGLLCLVPVIMINSWRYRLSRTSFRGIRFAFRGRFDEFARVYIECLIFEIVTLGFYTPYLLANLRKFLVQNTYFDNARFEFDGDEGELFAALVRSILMAPVTLGISNFWFRARKFNYYWSSTSLGGARVQAHLSGRDLAVLKLKNLLLTICTLGIFAAWARVRTIQFMLAGTSIQGTVEPRAFAAFAAGGFTAGLGA
jgi:uncharacterized membrane protein YjgN (DUF898 family)